MEIVFDAEVFDKDGQKLGTVDYIIRDAYTGDIRKFRVGYVLTKKDLFFSPNDVAESSAKKIKLKVAAASPEGK